MSNATAIGMLKGSWVTSYTGWMLFNPRQQKPDAGTSAPPLPPQIGGAGYDPNSNHFSPREGYFLVTALIRITLDGKGGVSGVMEFVRGGTISTEFELSGYRRRVFTKGTYTVGEDPDLAGVYEGTITETHINDGGPVDWTYGFVVRNKDELEYFWKQGDYRPVVTNGTLRRVNFATSPGEVSQPVKDVVSTQ